MSSNPCKEILISDPIRDRACPTCKRSLGFAGPFSVQRGTHTDPKKSCQTIFTGCVNCLIDLIDAARDKKISIGDPTQSQEEFCVCSTASLLIRGCPRKKGSKICHQEIKVGPATGII